MLRRLGAALSYALLWGALRWGGLMVIGNTAVQRWLLHRPYGIEDLLFAIPLYFSLGFLIGLMTWGVQELRQGHEATHPRS